MKVLADVDLMDNRLLSFESTSNLIGRMCENFKAYSFNGTMKPYYVFVDYDIYITHSLLNTLRDHYSYLKHNRDKHVDIRINKYVNCREEYSSNYNEVDVIKGNDYVIVDYNYLGWLRTSVVKITMLPMDFLQGKDGYTCTTDMISKMLPQSVAVPVGFMNEPIRNLLLNKSTMMIGFHILYRDLISDLLEINSRYCKIDKVFIEEVRSKG